MYAFSLHSLKLSKWGIGCKKLGICELCTSASMVSFFHMFFAQETPHLRTTVDFTELLITFFFSSLSLKRVFKSNLHAIGPLFYTSVAIQEIGRPGFNYLDVWVNTFGKKKSQSCFDRLCFALLLTVTKPTLFEIVNSPWLIPSSLCPISGCHFLCIWLTRSYAYFIKLNTGIASWLFY